MSERAAYSRVYWSIVDDEKFVTIYDSDAHLSAWLRLLLIADQSHPASAHLPSNVKRASVRALSDAGLVDLLVGNRYRIHGLDAERERRRQAATSRPPTNRGPNGHRTGTERSPNGSGTTGLRRDETRKDETRVDEGDARATLTLPEDDAPEWEAIVWLANHGCYLPPHSGYYRAVVLAVEQHGVNAFVGMLDRLAAAGMHNGDAKGFVFGAKDALDAQTRPSLKALETEDRAEEREDSWSRRTAATKVRAHELGMHLEPNPGCPSCAKVTA